MCVCREYGVPKSLLRDAVRSIEPVPRMVEFLKALNSSEECDTIIISDSNSYFIREWLDAHDLRVLDVFTNPSSYDGDLLRIKEYHNQNWCTMSTRNLCKGYILESFLVSQRDKGIQLNVSMEIFTKLMRERMGYGPHD